MRLKMILSIAVICITSTLAPTLAKQKRQRMVKLGDITYSVNDNKKQYPLLEGKGTPVSLSPDITDFNALRVEAPVTIEITDGDSLSCTLTGCPNQLDLIKVGTSGEVLSVSMRKSVRFEKEQPVRMVISLPGDGFVKLDIKRDAQILIPKPLRIPFFTMKSDGAAAKIECPDIETEKVRIKSSGVCLITMKGSATSVSIAGTGVCVANFSELKASETICDISGVGRCHIYATHSLTANISGTGSIVYYGNPEQVRKRISGLGTVTSGN